MRTKEEIQRGVIDRQLLDEMHKHWPDEQIERFLTVRLEKLERERKLIQGTLRRKRVWSVIKEEA